MSTEISRRVTLRWVAAASASGLIMAGRDIALAQTPATTGAAAPWVDAVLAPITAPGYGTDPDLKKGIVPWPLTLMPHQRGQLKAAAGLILPADDHSPSAATLPVDAFIDEWVSAPYPNQMQDRQILISGLTWLDAEAARRFQLDFVQASDAQRTQIFDTIAFRDRVQPGYEKPVQFFARLRGLTMAGFYALPEGVADLGYVGNMPMAGDWPGPTPEARAHLNDGLTKLGLKTV